MHVIRSLLMAGIASLATLSSAATFIGEEDPNFRSNPELVLEAQNAAANNELVFIGDMAFKPQSLLERGFTGRKWSNGVVPIAFHNNVTASNQQRFFDACGEWSAVANIRCVTRNNQRDFIRVEAGGGNWSFVGRQGGMQRLQIANWTYRFIIAHEIGHALGLQHEQSRSDRDQYVQIHQQNISQHAKRNFSRQHTRQYTPYDFASIMHYGRNAFSKNGWPTISPQPEYEHLGGYIGNRQQLSWGDAEGMRRHYGAVMPNSDVLPANGYTYADSLGQPSFAPLQGAAPKQCDKNKRCAHHQPCDKKARHCPEKQSSGAKPKKCPKEKNGGAFITNPIDPEKLTNGSNSRPTTPTGANTDNNSSGSKPQPSVTLPPLPNGRPSVENDNRYQDNARRSSADKIIGGRPSEWGVFPDVVALLGEFSEKAQCTGTLIGPRTVVTAKHCVCGGVHNAVLFGNEDSNGRHIPIIARVPANDQDCNSDILGGLDIGLVFLGSEINYVIPRKLADSDDHGSTHYMAVGFGLAGTDADNIEGLGVKNEAGIPIASYNCNGSPNNDQSRDADWYGCIPGKEIVAGAKGLNLDSCKGDSGGPLMADPSGEGFAKADSAAFVLAGITSRGVAPRGDFSLCGDGGIYVKITDEVQAWINEQQRLHGV